MAEVDERAVTSGVLHGIEVAVAGGLISPNEVLGETPPISQVIQQAGAIANELVRQAPQGDMPEWRQIMTGQIVGTAVAARTFGGKMDELAPENLPELLERLWKRIDRWVYDS